MKKLSDPEEPTPTILKDNTNVTFESIEMHPGDRAEIVLAPLGAVRNAVLFLAKSQPDSTVKLEQILHGRTAIFSREMFAFESFLEGKKIEMTVSDSEPLKIVLSNTSPLRTTVSASLAHNQETPDTTYRLTGDQITKEPE